jgi:septal ring factor EnvC (AmiA/AmiB activator)
LIKQSIKAKEDSLQQIKDSLKYFKKENDDLHRKLSDLQEKQLKNIENMEFRHAKFNEL